MMPDNSYLFVLFYSNIYSEQKYEPKITIRLCLYCSEEKALNLKALKLISKPLSRLLSK